MVCSRQFEENKILNSIDYVYPQYNNGYNLALQQSITVGKAQQDTPYTYNAPSIYEEEDLSYSNVTYPGMSGGAILDSKGGVDAVLDGLMHSGNNRVKAACANVADRVGVSARGQKELLKKVTLIL